MSAGAIGTRWSFRTRDREAEQILMQELGVGPLVAITLASNGIKTPESARDFLHNDLGDLPSPELLPDFELAFQEIKRAIDAGDLIYVHGDYDVDGVTSAAIFTRFLRAIGAKVEVHVPHRIREGYGIHENSVREAAAMGAKLFLTCDCGITAFESLALARSLGMRIVVTDHHEPTDKLPEADAIVNPHRHDSSYPFDALSGAGVVLKLCAGIAERLGHPVEKFYRAFMDLAALGTVADVMPLVGENRIIVRHGLELIPRSKKPGLRALLLVAMLNEAAKLKSWHISFQLAPRLNAAGRLDDAAISLNLLLESDDAVANTLAQDLERLNQERQAEQKALMDHAREVVMSKQLDLQPIIFVAGESWHHGIIGLIAGKLTEEFARPSFVLTYEPDGQIAKGSARSIRGYHLADALHALSHLVSGGGHELAAGFSVDLNQIDALHQALRDHAKGLPEFQPGVRQLELFAELSGADLTVEHVSALNQLEPFGMGNPQPVFGLLGVMVQECSVIGKTGEHLRLTVTTKDHAKLTALAFGCASRKEELAPGTLIDLAFTAQADSYQGRTSVKLMVKEFRRAESGSGPVVL